MTAQPTRIQLLGTVAVLLALSVMMLSRAFGELRAPATPPAAAPPQPAAMLREEMLGKCRPAIKRLFLETEAALRSTIELRPLEGDGPVLAASVYDGETSAPTIFARQDAMDVDIAHELMHLRLDLLDRFSVLAWRRDVKHDRAVEGAFGRIRSYVDDDIVHRRLVALGLQPDGEVIRPPLFDRLYAPAADNLDRGAVRGKDGMGHLDPIGHGALCRAAFLVQAEQILAQYGTRLSPDHRAKTERFIRAFRATRAEESALADRILALFAANDVDTDAGHQAISDGWVALEGLASFVGSTRYEVRYALPFPP